MNPVRNRGHDFYNRKRKNYKYFNKSGLKLIKN